jgi:hypothetical protein
MTLRLGSALVATVALGAISGCELTKRFNPFKGGSQERVDWRWIARTRYETTPGAKNQVFLLVRDREGDDDIYAGLHEGLKEKLKSELDLDVTNDPVEADYACYVYIRYFNASPAEPAPGSTPLEAEPLASGQQGWLDENGVVIDRPPEVPEIPPKGAGDRWDLMIDLTVGEKIAREGAPPVKHTRSGRLLGRVDGTRSDALCWFREGRPAATRADGTPEPPPRSATHLVNVLAKGLFRASGPLPESYKPREAAFVPSDSSQRPRIDWRRPKQPSFLTYPAEPDTFFLSVEDLEEDEELFKGLREGLIWKFENEGRLKYEADPEKAKYACYVYLRYFNGLPSPGELERAARDIIGGRKGWKLEGQDRYLGNDPIPEIPPMRAKWGFGILFDIAVGERTESDVILRPGRLLACLPRASREDALWLFRTGELPPPEPEVLEGQTPSPPAQPDPPQHLVDTLGESILSIRRGL